MENGSNEGFTSLSDLIKFQNKRQITNLFKSFLEIIDDLERGGYKFDDELRADIRRKVLSKGNNTVRELDGLLDKFDISLKK